MSAFLCIYMYLYMPCNIQKLLFNKKTTKSPMFNAYSNDFEAGRFQKKKQLLIYTGDLSELPTFLLFDTSKMVQFSNFNDPRLRGLLCVKKKRRNPHLSPANLALAAWPHLWPSLTHGQSKGLGPLSDLRVGRANSHRIHMGPLYLYLLYTYKWFVLGTGKI